MTKKEFGFSDFTAAVHIDYVKVKKIAGLTAYIRKSEPTISNWNYFIAKDNSITFHDLTVSQLRYLLKAYPLADVMDFETTIAFVPTIDDDKEAKVMWLHNHLRDNLHPRFNKQMMKGLNASRKWRRKYLDIATEKYIKDALVSLGGYRTIVWDSQHGREQVRMYIKDGVVRLEATLRRLGVQLAKSHKLILLPGLLVTSRVFHTPFFNVASGLRIPASRIRVTNPVKRLAAEIAAEKKRKLLQRSWELYGAAGAMKHGRQTRPNPEANAMIGKALKLFRETMKNAKLTENVAGKESIIEKELDTYQPLTSGHITT